MMLTPADVALRLNVGLSTVYGLLESGRLRSYRIGVRGKGTYRVAESDLVAYLAAVRVEGRAEEGPRVSRPRERGVSMEEKVAKMNEILRRRR